MNLYVYKRSSYGPIIVTCRGSVKGSVMLFSKNHIVQPHMKPPPQKIVTFSYEIRIPNYFIHVSNQLILPKKLA